MTDLKELKQNVLMTAKKAYDEKLMAGTSGNISAYFREKQWIVITPSSYDYSLMAEEDIVVIDLDGNLVEGRHKPSSEWKMHAEIYRHLSHANAVVHTHSPYASSFAVNHQEIPVVLIEMIPFLKGKSKVEPSGLSWTRPEVHTAAESGVRAKGFVAAAPDAKRSKSPPQTGALGSVRPSGIRSESASIVTTSSARSR